MTSKEDGIKILAETMELVARAQADKGVKVYTAATHAAGVGIGMSKALQAGMEPSRENMTALFHAGYNHSAWRQKFEKAGIFPTAAKRPASSDDLLKELAEEGV